MQAVVVLAPGFEEIEAVTPIDFLRRAGVDVYVAGVGGVEVTGSHGITIRCDGAIDELKTDLPLGTTIDAVVLPGGIPGANNLAASKAVVELIDRVHSGGGMVAAICAAPAVVLGNSPILQGRRATCYPGFEKHFSGDVIPSEERVVVDGKVLTSRGPGTATEFAIKLIEELVGESKALELHSTTLQR